MYLVFQGNPLETFACRLNHRFTWYSLPSNALSICPRSHSTAALPIWLARPPPSPIACPCDLPRPCLSSSFSCLRASNISSNFRFCLLTRKRIMIALKPLQCKFRYSSCSTIWLSWLQGSDHFFHAHTFLNRTMCAQIWFSDKWY